jgi:hypothetical protein
MSQAAFKFSRLYPQLVAAAATQIGLEAQDGETGDLNEP